MKLYELTHISFILLSYLNIDFTKINHYFYSLVKIDNKWKLFIL